MKKNHMIRMIRAGIITLVAGMGISSAGYAIDAGGKAPDFTLPGQQGTVNLSSKAGSVVYLDFWASWCGPCKQSFSWMNSMQEKYKSKGLQIIAINLDAKTEDAKKFLSQTPAKFTVAFDSNGVNPKVYGVKGMPTSYLIGRDGRIILQHAGFREEDRETLEKQIQTALEAKK
jgi:cytochrome c biogenesis protein CcmG, thiol:disulfide interchange protein DsbE